MSWSNSARRAVGCAVVVTALTAGVLPAPSGAASPVAGSSGQAPSGPVDPAGPGDLDVTAQTVHIDADRPARVDLHDRSDQDSLASAVVVHERSPEMLILPDVAPDTVLAVRSHDAEGWTDWIEVTADPDEAPDGLPGAEGARGASGIGPIWIGHDADRTEIAVLEGASGPLTIEELDVSSGPVGVRRATGSAGAQHLRAGATAPMASSAAQPSIRPRSAWATADMDWQCSGSPGRSENITAAVVHHTASTTDYAPADVPDILRGFWRYHARTNGWCDIAYNFLVDRFGTIWEGRQGGIDQAVIGGHAKGFNTSTTGIALIGHFGSAPAYNAMIDATTRLIAWKFALHGVDPMGWTQLINRASNKPLKYPYAARVDIPTVVGHRDLGLTSCPGTNVHATIGSIRRALATPDRVGSPPYAYERWSAASTGIAVATVDANGGVRVAGAAEPTTIVVSGTPVAVAGGDGLGYVLTSDRRLTPFSGAPDRQAEAGGVPVDLSVRTDGTSGWVIDRDGRFAGFGGAPSNTDPIAPGRTVAVDVDDIGRGYLVTSDGALRAVGGAPARGMATCGSAPIDVVVRSDRSSGWVLMADGSIRGFGGAADARRPTGSSAPRALLLAGDEAGAQVLDADGRIWPVGPTDAVTPVASHVGIANAVTAGRLGRPGLRATGAGRVVLAQHDFFLRSTPGVDRFHMWFHVTERRGRTGAALQMARSDDYAGLVVDDLYRRVFDRAADPGGRANWLRAIRDGMRIEEVGAQFYGSAEYLQRAGSLERFVELLYENLLFRSSDPDGHAAWVGALRSGELTAGQASAGFYNSIESRRDRVTRLYGDVLHRKPDPDGLAHWAQQLLTHDDLVLAAELAGSREFRDRVLRGTL